MNLGLSRLFSFAFYLQTFQAVLQTVHRFPLTFIALLIANFSIFNRVHDIHLLPKQALYYLFIFALGGVFWFASATLLKENLKWDNTKYFLLAVPVFVIYCWYVTSFGSPSTAIRLLVLAAGLCLTFSAWLFRSDDNASVWYFNYQLISAVCFALLSAVILCGGLSLILLSIGYLFEVQIFSQIYSDIWIIGLSFLAPIYLLTNIPTQFNYQRSECQFPKGINFILNYVLVPLTLIYMVILYAYLVKIIVQWSLPHGHLGKMISIFGIIGIFTHLAIYPIYDRSSAILSWFYRYFYLIMIVPLLLLSIAIGQRIFQYGVTEVRYLVVICTLWFAFLIVSYLKNQQKFHLKQVTLSLALLCFFSSFGPWGIYQLPVNSQYSRLESLLITKDILINGTIKVNQQPTLETRIAISSMVDYLYKHSAEQRLRPWFADKEAFDELLSIKDLKPHQRQRHSGQNIVELMGIDYLGAWQQRSFSEENATKTIDGQIKRLSFPITGYDIFIPINWMSSQQEIKLSIKLSANNDHKTKATLKINEQGKLILDFENGEQLSFDLEKVINKFPDGSTQVTADQTDKLIIVQSANHIEGALLIQHLVRDKKDGKKYFRHLTGSLLLKKGL